MRCDPMPGANRGAIHFYEAFRDIYLGNVENTIKTDSSGVLQDTVLQADTVQPQDTIEPQDTVDRQFPEMQTTLQDTLREDTVKAHSEPSETREIEPTPEPVTLAEQNAEKSPAETDTLAELHRIFGVTRLPITQRLEKDPAFHNFLYSIPAVKPREKSQSRQIYLQAKSAAETAKASEVQEIRELPIHKVQNGYDWITCLIIAAFLLMGWSRLFYRKFFVALLKSFNSYNYAYTLFYGKSSLTARASVLLNLVFFISAGIFLFQCLTSYDITWPIEKQFIQLLLLTGFFMAWYVWNYLTTQTIGFVFLRQESFQEYFHNYNLYRKMIGISLLPVILVLQFIAPAYESIFLLIGIILFAIIYFAHILRGVQIFLRKKVSIFYLILYLCALEILPLIVLYKLFIKAL